MCVTIGDKPLKKVLVSCAVALLLGCDTGSPEGNAATAPKGTPVTANYFSTSAIYLPDGAGIQFNGKMRRYDLVENEKGTFDRYTFEFAEDMMAVEGAVFATLAKSGYQRKVRRENEKTFVVNYVRKGFAPVSMTFERVSSGKETKVLTRLRVVWKNA
jgi:hypothetical protein